MEWVAAHLGHSLNVEREYYRALSTTIEKAKIAKLLMLSDAGSVDSFSGKKLEDIQFDGKCLHCNLILCKMLFKVQYGFQSHLTPTLS